jgi:hypothetical protein
MLSWSHTSQTTIKNHSAFFLFLVLVQTLFNVVIGSTSKNNKSNCSDQTNCLQSNWYKIKFHFTFQHKQITLTLVNADITPAAWL